MASLDTSLIRQELHAIQAASKAVSKQLRDALEKIESNPAQFPALNIPPRFKTSFPNVTIRKVRLESHKHSFRIIIAHWESKSEDHVDGLYAFPRKAGYHIDWDWVERVLDTPE